MLSPSAAFFADGFPGAEPTGDGCKPSWGRRLIRRLKRFLSMQRGHILASRLAADMGLAIDTTMPTLRRCAASVIPAIARHDGRAPWTA